MRVPLSWIREFTDTALPPEELARRLTLAGLEVEAIERIGAYSEQVIAAEILAVRDHPRRSDLKIVELGGGGEARFQALTGAPNVGPEKRGAKVAAALPGAILIDPHADPFALMEVEEREVYGIRSTAVLCSEHELGLSRDHSGILYLDPEAEPGTPVPRILKPGPEALSDIVLDVAILPNYGRCLSMIGMAREIAALARTSFRLSLNAKHVETKPGAFPVSIEDPDLCPRYTACTIERVRVRRSPDWLERRLVLAGVNPINNVVDVTNYVMLEMGQPMHAFDLDRLPAREIRVRTARPGETIATLDQKPDEEGRLEPRSLPEGILLITSGDVPVAVAGVIGGRGTEIQAETRSVLLESANFDPVIVRRAMTALKIQTDSALRFSRNVDPALTVIAIQRAAQLLEETADAEGIGPIADLYPRPAERRSLTVSAGTIGGILGLPLEPEEIASALERLGFEVEKEGEDRLKVDIPGFRADVSLPPDIAEEVIRVLGFDRLGEGRLAQPLPRQRRNLSWELRQRVRDTLAGCGLQDVISYSLTSPELEAKLLPPGAKPPPYTALLNPTSRERSVLRRTLLGGLLEAAARNHRNRARIALFELGPVFLPEKGRDGRPAEIQKLAILLSGPVREATWLEPEPRDFNFFDLKGVLITLLESLHVEGYRFERAGEAPFHPGICARLTVGDEEREEVGLAGELHPSVRDAFDLGGRRLIACELDLHVLLPHARYAYAYRPIPRFPPVRQDLALVVAEEVPAERVLEAIREAAGPLLRDIRIFDVYRGDQIGPGKKSLAFELTFAAEDRSLEEEEINRLRESMLEPLEKAVGAKIRR